MRALVTGGAGFIGSHLVDELLRQGYHARVVDDLSQGTLANLELDAVEFLEGDIADMAVAQEAVTGCDVVFHQAAQVSVPLSIEMPEKTYASNVTGTFNIFEAARRAGTGRIVYASSCAVYGNLPGLPKRESDPLAPASFYGSTKWLNEVLAHGYSESFGMTIVGLRYMNVFGPRQRADSAYSGVLSIFCRAAMRDETVMVHGDGEQTRDFVYVSDVVRANVAAAVVPADRLPAGAVFNIGSGQQTSLNAILDLLRELTGRALPAVYGPPRPGDIRHSAADIGRAREVLGFAPQVSVRDGLRTTWSFEP